MNTLTNEFFNEVHKLSKPSSTGFNVRVRNGVRFSLVEYSDIAYLAHLEAITQQRKDGSHFMAWLTGLADTFNITLNLLPRASFSNTAMRHKDQQAKLKEWYNRYGFVEVGDLTMTRVPNYNAKQSIYDVMAAKPAGKNPNNPNNSRPV